MKDHCYLLETLSSLLGLLLWSYRINSKLWWSTSTAPPIDEAHGHLGESTNQKKYLLEEKEVEQVVSVVAISEFLLSLH